MITDQNFLDKLTSKCLEFLLKGSTIAVKNINEMKLPEEFTNNLLDFILLSVSISNNIILPIIQMQNMPLFLFNSN